MRIPKPFKRRSKKSYYLQLGKRQISLGKNRKEAFTKWRQLLVANGLSTGMCEKVQDLADQFLEWASKHTAEVTYDYYRKYVEDFAAKFGRAYIDKLTIDEVEHWLDAHPTWNSPSRRAAIISIKRCFSWGVERQIVLINPIRTLKKPPVNRREVILAPGEHERILEASRGKSFKLFVEAMQLTGCRPGEIANVTAAEVDLEQGIWKFEKHKTRHQTGKPRIVYLTPRMVELSRELIEKYPEGPLFRNSRGKTWSRNAIAHFADLCPAELTAVGHVLIPVLVHEPL